MGDVLHDIPHTNMTERFDRDAAALVLKPGRGQITGRVALQGGMVGQFAQVRLIPRTAYAQEYMRFLFQGEKTYFEGRQIENLDPSFQQMMRYSNADHDGRYVFHGVPPGSFYVYATRADFKTRTYFAVMDIVEVGDGERVTVDLDGI